MTLVRLALVGLAALAPTASAQLAMTAWPLYRGDAAHTGRSRARATEETPERYWSFPLTGGSQTGVMVGPHGDLYFGTNEGEVISVDRSGAFRWRYRSQGPIRSAPCLTMDGMLYFGSFDGCVYALKARTGTLEWTYCIDRPVSSSIVVDEEGNLYFGATDNMVRSLDRNGAERWVFDNDSSITAASPTLDGQGHLYVGGYGPNGLVKLNTADGSLVWTLPMIGPPRNTAAIHDNGNIYVGTRTGYFYGVTPDGQVLWSRDLNAEIRTSAAISSNGNVIIATYDGYVYALNPDNGAQVWRTRIGMSVEGSPVVDAANHVFAGGALSPFSALDSDGTLLYTFGTEVTDGVVSIDGDGRLYGGSHGEVAAFGPPRPKIRVHISPQDVSPGETVTVTAVVENPSAASVTVDQRIWISGPDELPFSIVKQNGRILNGGLRDSTVVSAFNVPANVMAGAYRIEGRLIDPNTAWELSHAVERLDLRAGGAQRPSLDIHSTGDEK